MAPSTGVLFKLGLSGTFPVFAEDRWWTLITANYLHGSLLHLVFNVFALRAVGKINIEIYSSSRLFLIYFLGDLLSMAVSSLVGIGLTLGASGAICALIGSMSHDQWRASRGDLALRVRAVGVWIGLLVVTGIAMPNINNWGHGGGLITGIFFGWVLGYTDQRKENWLDRSVAVFLMGLTLVLLAIPIVQGFALVFG